MQPDTPSGSKWTRKADAQLAYLRAAQALKDRGKVSGDDFESLLWREPVGIDVEGRIVLAHLSAEAAAGASGDPLFVRLARALSAEGLAKGLSHEVAKPRQSTQAARRRVLYVPSFLASLTLPHSKVEGTEYSRVNGNRRLSLLAPEDPGLPYGVYPRLALIHLTTEAILCRQRTFYVGDSANDFLRLMGIKNSGGTNGASTRARNQLRRLCLTSITYHDRSEDKGHVIVLADNWVTWPGSGMQVTLGERFYKLARAGSVPLDPTIVHGLRRSPLSLDVYAWLTHRVFTLQRETVIPWRSLEIQFGAGYAQLRDFRIKFRRSLAAIQALWGGVDSEPLEKGLLVRPCAPSVLSWLERSQASGR